MPGINLHQIGRESLLFQNGYRYVCAPPEEDTDAFGTDNLETAVAGDQTSVDAWLPMPMSVGFDIVDAASTDLAVTVKIRGLNQFGEITEEEVSVAAGVPQYQNSVNAYIYLEYFEVTAISGNAASDTLAVGYVTEQKATTNWRIGLPRLQNEAHLVAAHYGTVTAGHDVTASLQNWDRDLAVIELDEDVVDEYVLTLIFDPRGMDI